MKGGYLEHAGTPSDALFNEIKFVDAAIGQMIAALKNSNVYDSTLIVITAKHGQSPMDSSRYTAMKSGSPVTTSPATILSNAGCCRTRNRPTMRTASDRPKTTSR